MARPIAPDILYDGQTNAGSVIRDLVGLADPGPGATHNYVEKFYNYASRSKKKKI